MIYSLKGIEATLEIEGLKYIRNNSAPEVVYEGVKAEKISQRIH